MNEALTLIVVAIVVLIGAPILALSIYQWRERRHHRRMNRRKTDKHQLL
jgi:hypothetical protein